MGARQRIAAVAKAVWLRLVFWGAVALVVLFSVADVRSLLGWRPFAQQPAEEAEPSQAGAPGWPHLRGPHYDAISDETGLADSWPPQGPPVLWSLKLGRGYSGFIAVGGRVYTQIQTLARQSVVCLDADTGRQIWEYGYGWPYEPAGMYPGPRATPTWHAGRIYFAAPDGLVGCLRAGDGGLVWSVNVNKKFGGHGTEFGYACSPLVEDGKVILPVGGEGASVVALDADNGSTAWASGDEPASYSSAVPITLRGRRHVVALLQNAVVLLDLSTGRLLWQKGFSAGYDEHATFPLYEEPYLMVTSPFQGGSVLYRLEINEPRGTGQEPPAVSAAVVRQSRVMSNDVASSVLVGGYVFGFDLSDIQAKVHRPSNGEFKCMELATGKVLWSTARPGHATVLAADGKLLLGNDSGEVLLIRANPRGYEELGRTQVFRGEICWTAPALDRGRLYLRSPSQAACLYVGRPEQLGAERLAKASSASKAAPSAPMNWTVLLGQEREYPFDPPDARELGRWYGFSMAGVLLLAAILAMLAYLAARGKWPQGAQDAARIVFWSSAFVLGVAGTPVFNRFSSEFVFTWPVSVFVAHQAALTAIVWAGRQVDRRKSGWVSTAAVVVFFAVGLGYFDLCRRLGMAVAWVFLLGFVPSWPIAVPAAYKLSRPGSAIRDVCWAVLAFTAYFWLCGGFSLWRAN